MKKFSKILSRRRLGRSGGGDDHGRWDPGQESSLDFHQLTSRRWRSDDHGLAMNGEHHSRFFTKEVPRYGAGRILADGSEDAGQLCDICQDIDFASLLDWQPGDPRPWVSLAHCLWLKLPEDDDEGEEIDEEERRRRRKKRRKGLCPWCVFFHSMITTVPEGDETNGADGRDDRALRTKFTPYLRIRLAFERLGGGEKHPLGRSVLFEVTTRNRSLPWGYIVKALPEDREGAEDPEADAPAKTETEQEAETEPDAESGIEASITQGGVDTGTDSGVEADVDLKEEGLSEIKPRARIEGDADEQAVTKQNGHAKVNRSNRRQDETREIRGREITPLLRLQLARSWIDFCDENHAAEDCSAKHRPLVKGLKLIDCEENRVILAEQLSATAPLEELQDDRSHTGTRNSHDKGTRHQNVDYVTLSYVSGSSSDADTEIDDDHLLPESLPKLIADAISTTKGLGYRYLWVDRYCMPAKGDAERATERQQQLSLIGQIFSHSTLTLIVAAGEGVEDGIAGVSVPRDEQLSIQTETDLFTTSLLRPDLEVASSKWASRAWTYQEGLLSRRRLIFTPSQVYFQCQAIHCHESLALPLKYAPGLNLGRVFPHSTEAALHPTRFKNHIKAYLAKSLTNTDDYLDAFRGLLHEYSRREKRPVEHLLGLPLFHPDDFSKHKVVSQTDRLAVALGWMPVRTLPSSSMSSSTTSSYDDLLHNPVVDPYSLIDSPCPFPSWTWLAWRPNQTTYNYNTPSYTLNFNLVDDTSPLLDGVSAAPGMEISVGFSDGMVLSWEIDGDAIARKADKIEMLRVKTYCFDLAVKSTSGVLGAHPSLALAEPAASILGRSASESVDAWIRRSSVTVLPASADEAPVEPEYHLIGVLISGRHWKPNALVHRPPGSAAITTPSTATATALICGRRNWDPEGQLIRLGALSIAYDGLVPAADEADASVMKGVDARSGEKRDLRVRLRELDIY
ncbi:HET-domain-containing protein [Trichoderma citrinoviride]|uniref:HET-domain-containing protein n=1 Tax=Trichoderma citrinoviride TaxID=58853 RepID=A0A2T4BFJ0_9HYPO|nr:HET-domain-containing protein [Trichoderma citrinoviride]PTB68011.1 HET-domain-containing protein [Trichoderma citrinoviride]